MNKHPYWWTGPRDRHARAGCALTAAGCGDDDEGVGRRRRRRRRSPDEGGKGEGEVNLIAWAGYVEDGSTDPNVDWVTDFEKKTGCQVNVKIGNTSDEMVTLMRTGNYDSVLSASGDATPRLDAWRRRSRQHRSDPELQTFSGAHDQAAQHGRRAELRRAAIRARTC